MLYATWHRQPIVNGTNGFFPPDQSRFLTTLSLWPAPEALAALREARVKYVIIDKRFNPSAKLPPPYRVVETHRGDSIPQ